MRLSAMGDVALCVPVLLALQRKYPETELIALSRKRFQPILSQVPGLTFLTAEVEGQHKGILGLYKLAKKINLLEPDAAVDLHNVLRTKLLRNLIKAPVSIIDKGRSEKRRLVNDPNFFQALPHTSERYLDAINQMGYHVQLEGNEFLPKPRMTDSLKILSTGDGRRWVGLAPFAAHETKALTQTRIRELLTALVELENVCLLLFGGGKKETAQLKELAKGLDNVVNIAGTTSFENELALLSRLDVMIAMDSGNGHLAALYGVPVLTIWGNTHPYAGFAPYAQPATHQLIPNLDNYPLVPTSIFGNKVIAGYENAADSISNDSIISKVKELLQG